MTPRHEQITPGVAATFAAELSAQGAFDAVARAVESTVPEPATLGILAVGLGGLVALRRRMRY